MEKKLVGFLHLTQSYFLVILVYWGFFSFKIKACHKGIGFDIPVLSMNKLLNRFCISRLSTSMIRVFRSGPQILPLLLPKVYQWISFCFVVVVEHTSFTVKTTFRLLLFGSKLCDFIFRFINFFLSETFLNIKPIAMSFR